MLSLVCVVMIVSVVVAVAAITKFAIAVRGISDSKVMPVPALQTTTTGNSQ